MGWEESNPINRDPFGIESGTHFTNYDGTPSKFYDESGTRRQVATELMRKLQAQQEMQAKAAESEQAQPTARQGGSATARIAEQLAKQDAFPKDVETVKALYSKNIDNKDIYNSLVEQGRTPQEIIQIYHAAFPKPKDPNTPSVTGGTSVETSSGPGTTRSTMDDLLATKSESLGDAFGEPNRSGQDVLQEILSRAPYALRGTKEAAMQAGLTGAIGENAVAGKDILTKAFLASLLGPAGITSAAKKIPGVKEMAGESNVAGASSGLAGAAEYFTNLIKNPEKVAQRETVARGYQETKRAALNETYKSIVPQPLDAKQKLYRLQRSKKPDVTFKQVFPGGKVAQDASGKLFIFDDNGSVIGTLS